jgi:hypothetical protein
MEAMRFCLFSVFLVFLTASNALPASLHLAPLQLIAVPGNGTEFVVDTTVNLTASDSTAVIYYTTDGTLPDTADSLQQYRNPFTIRGDTVIVKAVAVRNDSILASATWTYFQIYPQIIISAVPGSGAHFTIDTSIALIAVPSHATIHYTLDGTIPTSGSPLYVTPIVLRQSATIKAVTYTNGYIGTYGSWSYICDLLGSWISAAPGDSTRFTASLNVTLGSNADTLFYTVNGTDPLTNGILYTRPFTISGGVVVVRAVVMNAGYEIKTGMWTYFGTATGPVRAETSENMPPLTLEIRSDRTGNIYMRVLLPIPGEAEIRIFDPSGSLRFVRQFSADGRVGVSLGEKIASPGVYIARLRQGRASVTQRFLVR